MCGKDQGPSFIIQGEYPEQVGGMKKSPSKKSVKSDQSRPRYMSQCEAQLLLMMFQGVSFKFERLGYELRSEQMKNEVEKTVALVGRIVTKKSLKSLMRTYLDEIPRYLGFADTSVLFHDNEKELLYTITFGDDEEQKLNF